MKKLKMNSTTKKSFVTYAVVIVAYVALMVFKSTGLMKSSLAGMLVPICAYVVMALSLNLTVGVMGELSLGHAGFMAIGAFSGAATTQILAESIGNGSVRLVIGLIVGAIMGAIFGFLIGIPVLRLNGDYLAIVTLGFAEIIRNIFTNVYLGVDQGKIKFSFLHNNLNLSESGKVVIEGAMGARNIPRTATFTAGFILIMLSLIVIYNMINSRTGRAVMALRDNRIAAESVGIPVFKYKITAFVISAAMAGAAGALFGNNYSTLSSAKFNIDTSILILVFVVLGGQGNMLGSIIAAAALTVLPELLRKFADYRMLTYAVILILVMLVSNNPKMKVGIDKFKSKISIGKKNKEVIANE